MAQLRSPRLQSHKTGSQGTTGKSTMRRTSRPRTPPSDRTGMDRGSRGPCRRRIAVPSNAEIGAGVLQRVEECILPEQHWQTRTYLQKTTNQQEGKPRDPHLR